MNFPMIVLAVILLSADFLFVWLEESVFLLSVQFQLNFCRHPLFPLNFLSLF